MYLFSEEVDSVLFLKKVFICSYRTAAPCRERPNDLFHHEAALDLAGASAAPATDYQKRPHVFRVKLVNGGEYLFQGQNTDDMNKWCQYINRNATLPASAAGTPRGTPVQRASTMPAGSRPEQLATPSSSGAQASTSGGPSSGKKKFFTLGRSSKR